MMREHAQRHAKTCDHVRASKRETMNTCPMMGVDEMPWCQWIRASLHATNMRDAGTVAWSADGMSVKRVEMDVKIPQIMRSK